MNKNEKFGIWLSTICKHILPDNEMAQVRTFARELAEGFTKRFWNIAILSESTTYYLPRPSNVSHPPNDGGVSPHSISIKDLRKGNDQYGNFTKRTSLLEDKQSTSNFIQYLQNRWGYDWPTTELLEVNGYIKRTDKKHIDWEITKLSFDLLKESEPVTIFISYKRSDSSAFAMYVLTRLKQEGLEAFIDMALIPGEDWHEGLKERIKKYDCLIALIGKHTLKSDVCIEEIEWAIEAGLKIIPVWHNRFKFVSNKWNLKPKTEDALEKKHAIQVKEESASGYNAAMVEILNFFGITP